MIITFYDKDFNALQNNASLNVGEWSLTRRAVDFDDFTATSEPFLEDMNPTFVVLKDDYGRYKYAAFAGIPELTTEDKTQLQASDLKTIFNNEILSSLGTYTKLGAYFDDLFTVFDTQVVQGSFTIEYDTSRISHIDLADLVPSTELAVYNVWEDCILPYLKYYDVYIETLLDVKQHKIIFTFKLTNDKTVPLRLWEFNIRNYGKYITSLNETQGIVSNGGVLTYGTRWILKADNGITTDTTLRDLYPIKRKVIFEETDDADEVQDLLTQANVDALKELVEARYQESFTISAVAEPRYANVDFDTRFMVYADRNVFYKYLPLGEIVEDSRGTKTLKIGYKPEDIIYYF